MSTRNSCDVYVCWLKPFRSDQGFGVSPSMLVADVPTRLCCADWCTRGQGTNAKDVFLAPGPVQLAVWFGSG